MNCSGKSKEENEENEGSLPQLIQNKNNEINENILSNRRKIKPKRLLYYIRLIIDIINIIVI